VFGYASYRDVLERRVRDEVWYPLVVLGLGGLTADLLLLDTQTVAVFAAISLLFGGVFGYFFYRIGAFGGADMKAIVVLSLLFPVYPDFWGLPVVRSEAGVFILTVLGNTVVVGALYPLGLLVENILRHGFSNPVLMVVGRQVKVDDLHTRHGRILKLPDESMTFSGTDLDFFRDYVDWRDLKSLSEVDASDLHLREFVNETDWVTDDIENDEEEMRRILKADKVWITPGIPFILPMTVGLVVALTYGDVVYAVLRWLFLT
ncbi:MAG: A24 family peptidase C-terminal domain-containing protein, partial [Halobacteria archaeon]|nr:A24 family peptidase C-terminal domain-containing protein [Halobacteria archaeon]